MRRAYIQQDSNNQWLNENCFSSSKGFSKLQYDVKPFQITDLDFIELNKEIIYHGGINTIRSIFDKLNVKQPLIHNPHIYLPEYIKRNMYETTLGEIKQLDNVEPFFIKPLEDHKLFTGFVVKNFYLDMIKIKNLSDDIKILKSDCINMVSEYRCFILKKEIIGAKCYTGDFRILLNFDIVENAIKDYVDQPIAYSLDFCVTDKNETVLIEINDGFSLGSYGLDSALYAMMIRDRWNEIVGN